MTSQVVRMLEKQLNLVFHNPELVQQAFRHTSYVNEQASKQLQHNERLEFLGDAVLELLVSDFLYQTYPALPEGKLTRMRAQLVREESLATLARQLRFDHYLQLGKGEELSGGRERNSILADCFEAFLGAVFEDCGMEVAKAYLNQVMLQHHQTLISQVSQDHKTMFQERVQQQGSVTIQYRLLEQKGPAHAQQFKIGLYVADQLIATGEGKSKKMAEMAAAKIGLTHYDSKGRLKQ